MRTINSPGVQITEKDLSLRVETPTGTTVFVPGFASSGPVGEPIQITTTSELEAIFGVPTNAAERYFYYACREILNSPGQLLAARLPYGTDAGFTHSTKSYSGLFYPASYGLNLKELERTGEEQYEWRIGAPIYKTLTYEEYQSLLQDNFDWTNTSEGSTTMLALRIPIFNTIQTFGDNSVYSALEQYATNFSASNYENLVANKVVCVYDADAVETIEALPEYAGLFSGQGVEVLVTAGNADFVNPAQDALTEGPVFDPTQQTEPVVAEGIQVTAGFFVLNDIQSSINELGEGYYVGFADNYSLYADSPNFDSILTLETVKNDNNEISDIPTTRLEFVLSATKMESDQGVTSVSESLEKVGFVGFEQPLYQDHLSLGIFRVRRSTVDPNRLTLGATERYLGSFDSNRKQVNTAGGTPQNAFIEDIVNNASPGVKMFINPAISRNFDWSLGTMDSAPQVRITVDSTAKKLSPLGVYMPDTRFAENSKIVGNVPLKIEKLMRSIETPESVTLDIIVDAGLTTIFASTYDQTLGGNAGFNDEKPKAVDNFYQEAWKSVAVPFINFAENTRRDCMAIIDPPRHLFVNGRDTKILDQPDKNFTEHVYNPLKKLASLESNYTAMYGNWLKINDIYSSRRFWMPASPYAAAVFARSDAATQPWIAAAGLNRGTFNCIDIAINPNQKQRDRLYEIAVNPIVFFNGDGHVIMGQKTLQTRPTAFDRINVRRLFLTLERAVARTVKFFVFEPNTPATRTRLVNTISPLFDFAKNNEGLYDYLIVCDERNNTPESIDNNELIVDIYIKPVRAAEFILINFIATRTGQDFTEIL